MWLPNRPSLAGFQRENSFFYCIWHVEWRGLCWSVTCWPLTCVSLHGDILRPSCLCGSRSLRKAFSQDPGSPGPPLRALSASRRLRAFLRPIWYGEGPCICDLQGPRVCPLSSVTWEGILPPCPHDPPSGGWGMRLMVDLGLETGWTVCGWPSIRRGRGGVSFLLIKATLHDDRAPNQYRTGNKWGFQFQRLYYLHLNGETWGQERASVTSYEGTGRPGNQGSVSSRMPLYLAMNKISVFAFSPFSGTLWGGMVRLAQKLYTWNITKRFSKTWLLVAVWYLHTWMYQHLVDSALIWGKLHCSRSTLPYKTVTFRDTPRREISGSNTWTYGKPNSNRQVAFPEGCTDLHWCRQSMVLSAMLYGVQLWILF